MGFQLVLISVTLHDRERHDDRRNALSLRRLSLLSFLWPWPWPSDLMYEPDLYIPKTYQHTNNELCRTKLSKITALQTNRQTGVTPWL